MTLTPFVVCTNGLRVYEASVLFCIKNLELRRILMSLASSIAIYPQGFIKCLNYFIVFRTAEIV